MAATKPTHAEHDLPGGWQRVRLGDVATLQRGMDLPEADREPGQVPVYGSNGRLGFHDSSPIDGPGVITGRSGSIGIVYYSHSAYWPLNTTLYVKDFHGNNVRYIYHLLSNLHLEQFAASTGVPSLNRNFVHPYVVAVPPLPEQRAIAAVLDSIDEAIEGDEAVIAATEGLRDALLHDLLARGLPGQHTEFRDVPGLGAIPTAWDVVRLGDVAEVTSGLAMGPHRIPQKSPRPYLTVANVQANEVSIDENRLMEVSESEYQSRTLRTGDLVLVEGHAQISQLGRAAIIPSEADGYTFQNHLFRVRTGELSDARFVAAYVNGHGGRRYFGSFGGTTSGLNTVSAANVKALPVPLPSLIEQHRIASMLDGVDAAIHVAREEAARLRLLKDSAAAALLSGRVRVAS